MPLIKLSTSTPTGKPQLVDDPWRRCSDEEEIEPGTHALVSPQRGQALEIRRDGVIGVVFSPDDLVEDWAELVSRSPVIAIEFPRFTDGRGYSSARVLRSRLGYEGPLRAIGDILPDQVYYLARVGFDELGLRADKDARTAIDALSTFSVRYQASQDGPPLFRVRSRA